MVGYMRAFFEGWCMDSLADFLEWYDDYALTSGEDWGEYITKEHW